MRHDNVKDNRAVSKPDRANASEQGFTAPVHPFVIRPFYERDGITIYNADCRKVLPFLDPVDLVLTDPPYGIGENGKRSNRNRKPDARWQTPDNKDYGENTWDTEPIPDWLLGQIVSMGKSVIVFGGNYYAMPPAKKLLIWDKDSDGKNGADCEIAWSTLDGTTKRLRWLWDGFRMEKNETRWHPTQKPLGVMKWAISQAPDTVQTVLDPFMGVGTTLVAAKLMGKRAVGIEINESYCEAAVRRLRQGVLPLSG